jgi:hypothetical protein
MGQLQKRLEFCVLCNKCTKGWCYVQFPHCLAFAGTSGAVSILGNVQQQGVRVSFDTAKSTVGFSSNKC